MKTRLNFLLAAVIMFSVNACYPGGAEYVDELDTSISIFDDAYSWDVLSGKTYALPQQILHVKNGEEVEDPDRVHDANILSQMRQELGALGMTEAVADTSVAIAIVIIEKNNSGAAWIPGGGWWGGWYPGYPGWGWGGYYPWYPVYYSYKTGSVLIEMADYESRNVAEETVPLVYTGVLDGLMQGNDKYIGERIARGIDELFHQAPFN